MMTKNSEAENNPSVLFIRNLREHFSSSVFPFILECGRGWKKGRSRGVERRDNKDDNVDDEEDNG
jgi:hypothetical protein